METSERHNDELEQMRRDMDDLRSLLNEQKIVNEQLMRRAMSRELGKEWSAVRLSVTAVAVAAPTYWVMMPTWHLPLWFTLFTVAYLLVCAAASVWSVRRLTSENLITGDLLTVAARIAQYKKLTNDWLKLSIPTVCVWIACFVYYCSQGMNAEMRAGFYWGVAAGIAAGGAMGVWHLAVSRRRLNGILRQIDDIRGGQA